MEKPRNASPVAAYCVPLGRCYCVEENLQQAHEQCERGLGMELHGNHVIVDIARHK